MKKIIAILAISTLVIISMTGCTKTEEGATIGAGIGVVAGGGVLGAGAGALVGGAVGNSQE